MIDLTPAELNYLIHLMNLDRKMCLVDVPDDFDWYILKEKLQWGITND